jgi:hypothetical protein
MSQQIIRLALKPSLIDKRPKLWNSLETSSLISKLNGIKNLKLSYCLILLISRHFPAWSNLRPCNSRMLKSSHLLSLFPALDS